MSRWNFVKAYYEYVLFITQCTDMNQICALAYSAYALCVML